MPGTADVAVRQTREKRLSLAILAATIAGRAGTLPRNNGFSFGKRIAYLCEVTTHLDGLLIGSSAATGEKYARQRANADRYL